MGKYSEEVQKKLSKICKQFCKDANLKIVFTSFKIKSYFSAKDKKPYFFKPFLVYKFLYARCNCYIGEPVLTLKQESMNMCKMTKNLIFTSAQ